MTTFKTGNYVRIASRQSGRNDLLKPNLTGVPSSLLLFHYPNAASSVFNTVVLIYKKNVLRAIGAK